MKKHGEKAVCTGCRKVFVVSHGFRNYCEKCFHTARSGVKTISAKSLSAEEVERMLEEADAKSWNIPIDEYKRVRGYV